MIQLLLPLDSMEVVYSASSRSSSRASPAASPDFASPASSAAASAPPSPARTSGLLAPHAAASRSSASSAALPGSLPSTAASVWQRPQTHAAETPAHAAHEATAAASTAPATANAAAAAEVERVPLTEETIAELNEELASRTPQEILQWLRGAELGNVIQFTSFGLSGMMITDLLSKMGWNIPIAFIDTLYHFDEVCLGVGCGGLGGGVGLGGWLCGWLCGWLLGWGGGSELI